MRRSAAIVCAFIGLYLATTLAQQPPVPEPGADGVRQAGHMSQLAAHQLADALNGLQSTEQMSFEQGSSTAEPFAQIVTRHWRQWRHWIATHITETQTAFADLWRRQLLYAETQYRLFVSKAHAVKNGISSGWNGLALHLSLGWQCFHEHLIRGLGSLQDAIADAWRGAPTPP